MLPHACKEQQYQARERKTLAPGKDILFHRSGPRPWPSLPRRARGFDSDSSARRRGPGGPGEAAAPGPVPAAPFTLRSP